jgi:TatA/E family protein of Tat protein translocase
MPFGVHGVDLIVVLAIALLIFGPKKLPEMGASIGKSIKEFKKGMAELTEPKAESPAAYETISREPVVASYTPPVEPVASYVAPEPLAENYETPTTVEADVIEHETNVQ